MIYFNNKPITDIYYNGRSMTHVYYGTELVWSKSVDTIIASCYALGYWVDQYPWTDNTAWKD